MASAVFGDFLSAASEHLAAAVTVGDGENTSSAGVTRDLHHLVAVMSRYCDDLIPCDMVEAAGRNDLHVWERAAVDVGSALSFARDCLRRTIAEARVETDVTTAWQASHLAAAATELAAGRDLLNTHLAVDPGGLMRERSEWAPVVTSLPVTRALLNELARQSRQLAPLTAWLAGLLPRAGPRSSGQPASAPARDELANASQWLQVAGAAARAAFGVDPVRTGDTELLSAIPPAIPPQRQRPDSAAESIAEMCYGIAISASRLRATAHRDKERAGWSPIATSGSWQWTAQAVAITSHLGELALRSLAVRATQLADRPVTGAQLQKAADSMISTCAAWRQVDQMWDLLFTESQLQPTPAMTDASDLVLRMGRLVWNDPQWTPAHSQRGPRRTPDALAPGAATLVEVVSAAHQAVDAFARIATNDTDAVAAAIRAGRLYTPTRSLPDDYDVPRPFAPAPMARCAALQDAYRAAVDASIDTAGVFDELAFAIGAQSRALGLARAAASMQSRRRGRQSPVDNDPGDLLSAGISSMHSRASTGRAGSVEQAIRDRRVSDPVLLLRAAAIDDAARELMIRAESALPMPGSPGSLESARHAISGPAQLAAQSFPKGPTMDPPIEIRRVQSRSPRDVMKTRQSQQGR